MAKNQAMATLFIGFGEHGGSAPRGRRLSSLQMIRFSSFRFRWRRLDQRARRMVFRQLAPLAANGRQFKKC